jgi:hypothetical protein
VAKVNTTKEQFLRLVESVGPFYIGALYNYNIDFSSMEQEEIIDCMLFVYNKDKERFMKLQDDYKEVHKRIGS